MYGAVFEMSPETFVGSGLFVILLAKIFHL